MKRHLILAVTGALVMEVAASPATAAVATGRIRSINQFSNTATLDSGDSFFFDSGVDISGLHIGELVKITYRGIGSGKRVVAVTPLN